jgi:orotidine-5'-phosphate decarboxylase
LDTPTVVDKLNSPIILAVDTNSLEIAKRWIEATRESVDIFKLGLEFYLTFGSDGIRSISNEFGVDIFLDLKLHDIPKTVSSATASVASLNPRFLTVHASGGSAMVSAAVSAAPHVGITAVTILTSLSEDELFRIGFANPALESAVALAELATSAGAQAIVCSPLEIAAIRAVVSPDVKIITPGVRPAGTEGRDDQMRTMTPQAALREGADFVVIGRPITGAWTIGSEAMRDAARKIYEDLSQ